MNKHYITGQKQTIAGNVFQISTEWNSTDIWETIKVRW